MVGSPTYALSGTRNATQQNREEVCQQISLGQLLYFIHCYQLTRAANGVLLSIVFFLSLIGIALFF